MDQIIQKELIIMKKIILLVILFTNTFVASVWAAASFTVEKIEIRGLHRVSPETAYSYLPIKRGQTFGPGKTASVIKSLYKTGFFDHNITLDRSGNTLIINVKERPTIGQLKISGNSVIPTDKLTAVMKSLDIAEGRVYNPQILDRIKQGLLSQYYELGRYNARVDTTVTPMERNRVLVKIDISEGLVAKIRRINIIGNNAFSEKTLLKQLTITTPGMLTFFTQTDRYSQEKLEESVDKLRNYYLDHGYVKVSIKSNQVAITPDRKSVYLTIVIDEGEPYRISGVSVTGNTILPREEIVRLMNIKPGDTFSRQAIMRGEKAVSSALGDKGYLFATVSLNPKIDDAKKEAFLTFEVKPGKRVYVHQINFVDNTKTNDEVYRREMQQMESSVVSTTKLEQSKHRLSLLPYIKDVQMSVAPVEGEEDQVDVNYKVTEDNAAQANVTLGYSQQYGIQFGAGLNQKNFLGTGKTLGFNFTKNRFEQFYGLSYTNPYYTPDGVSRSLGLSVLKVDPANTNTSASYTMNQYSLSALYSIPVFHEKYAFNRVQLGYGYEDTVIHLTDRVSREVQNFVNKHGRHFGQASLLAGYSRDSRDRAIFPTSGMIHTLGANVYLPATSGDLAYFTTSYGGKLYYPLFRGFIATAKGQLGYGSSLKSGPVDFPFYKYFYAGGIESVRGYLGNTLGPRDSRRKPIGGNAVATASIGLIFPNYISDNFRTSLFVDAGNAYVTYNNKTFGGTDSGSLRYSTGIQGSWLTMFGMIDVSFAKALNPRKGHGTLGDETEPFQFSLGANFG